MVMTRAAGRTFRCPRRSAFEVVGAEVTQGGVTTAWVVPALDEYEDHHARLDRPLLGAPRAMGPGSSLVGSHPEHDNHVQG